MLSSDSTDGKKAAPTEQKGRFAVRRKSGEDTDGANGNQGGSSSHPNGGSAQGAGLTPPSGQQPPPQLQGLQSQPASQPLPAQQAQQAQQMQLQPTPTPTQQQPQSMLPPQHSQQQQQQQQRRTYSVAPAAAIPPPMQTDDEAALLQPSKSATDSPTSSVGQPASHQHGVAHNGAPVPAEKRRAYSIAPASAAAAAPLPTRQQSPAAAPCIPPRQPSSASTGMSPGGAPAARRQFDVRSAGTTTGGGAVRALSSTALSGASGAGGGQRMALPTLQARLEWLCSEWRQQQSLIHAIAAVQPPVAPPYQPPPPQPQPSQAAPAPQQPPHQPTQPPAPPPSGRGSSSPTSPVGRADAQLPPPPLQPLPQAVPEGDVILGEPPPTIEACGQTGLALGSTSASMSGSVSSLAGCGGALGSQRSETTGVSRTGSCESSCADLTETSSATQASGGAALASGIPASAAAVAEDTSVEERLRRIQIELCEIAAVNSDLRRENLALLNQFHEARASGLWLRSPLAACSPSQATGTPSVTTPMTPITPATPGSVPLASMAIPGANACGGASASAQTVYTPSAVPAAAAAACSCAVAGAQVPWAAQATTTFTSPTPHPAVNLGMVQAHVQQPAASLAPVPAGLGGACPPASSGMIASAAPVGIHPSPSAATMATSQPGCYTLPPYGQPPLACGAPVPSMPVGVDLASQPVPGVQWQAAPTAAPAAPSAFQHAGVSVPMPVASVAVGAMMPASVAPLQTAQCTAAFVQQQQHPTLAAPVAVAPQFPLLAPPPYTPSSTPPPPPVSQAPAPQQAAALGWQAYQQPPLQPQVAPPSGVIPSTAVGATSGQTPLPSQLQQPAVVVSATPLHQPAPQAPTHLQHPAPPPPAATGVESQSGE